MSVGAPAYFVLAAALFSVGLYGVLSKRSALSALLSLEVMAGAVVLNLAAVAHFAPAARLQGLVLALLTVVVAGGQVALSVAAAVALRRRAGAGGSDGTGGGE